MRRSHCNRLPAATRPRPVQPSIAPFVDTSLVPARAGLDATATVAQMASDMREASHREGGMTRDDLERLGYTAAQIDTHAAAARARANELAVMS